MIAWIERFYYNCNGKLKIQLNNNQQRTYQGLSITWPLHLGESVSVTTALGVGMVSGHHHNGNVQLVMQFVLDMASSMYY